MQLIDKVLIALQALRDDVNALKTREPPKGAPGEPGTPGKDAPPVDLEAVAAKAAELVPPGKDAPPVDIETVAVKAAALIPAPKDGRDGRDAPPLETIAKQAAAFVPPAPKGEPGPRGTPGKDAPPVDPEAVAVKAAELVPAPEPGKRGPRGKPGASVTGVRLAKNQLYVAIDGAEKPVGRIELPKPETFTPGKGGGGVSRRAVELLISNRLVNLQLISNRLVINNVSDWPKIEGGYIPLPGGVEYYIGSHVAVPAPLLVQGRIAIRGAPNVSRLVYAGTEPMIQGQDFGGCLIYGVDIVCPINTPIFDVSDTTPQSIINLEALTILSGSLGSYNGILAFTIDTLGATLGQGLADTGSTSVILSVFRFLAQSTNAGLELFNLGNSQYQTIEMRDVSFGAPVGAKMLVGLSDSQNVQPNQVAKVESCETSGGAVVLGGGITPDDVRYRFEECTGVRNTSPDALISMTGNATPTTITTQGVPVKVAGVWVEQEVSHFSSDATGRITYIAEVERHEHVDIVLDLVPVSGVNKVLTVYLAINGTPVTASARSVRVDADVKSLAVLWQHDFTNGDYVEAFVANDTDATDVLVSGGVIRI